MWIHANTQHQNLKWWFAPQPAVPPARARFPPRRFNCHALRNSFERRQICFCRSWKNTPQKKDGCRFQFPSNSVRRGRNLPDEMSCFAVARQKSREGERNCCEIYSNTPFRVGPHHSNSLCRCFLSTPRVCQWPHGQDAGSQQRHAETAKWRT